jgi:hypothetical protein
MGWFIGLTGHNRNLKSKILEIVSEPTLQVNGEDFYVAGGGLENTFYYRSSEQPATGWMAAGIGISTGTNPTLLGIDSWEKALAEGAGYLHSLNGHFAIVKWKPNEIELITDQLGIRNIFVIQDDDYCLFSTRLDWILNLISETEINWQVFGSRWLGINQFSNKSFIRRVERVSQGGTAIIQDGKLHLSQQRWNLSFQVSTDKQDFKQSLLAFSTLPLKEDQRLSLGLSGGLDSRTLFASLLQIPKQQWGLHTFGEPHHPDLKTAEKLNTEFGRTHHIFREHIPEASKLIDLIPDYVGQTMFTAAPSHLIGFQAYAKLQELNLSIVDGAFGEIARRRFMVSVLLRAKKAVMEKDAEALLPYFKLHRADIFQQEITQIMLNGFLEELETELKAMPEVSDIGLENWLDLFTIRTRVHNTAGPEQARSDSLVFNYMPFLQPELIRMAINLPLSERKNARLFRQIIRDSAPALQKTPLVKGAVSYPYWMKDISSALWMRLKKKLGKEHHSSLQADFLLKIEDYVRDLFSSQSAREFSPYDQNKIQDLVTGFYDKENHAFAHELNWALAFEVFRRL